jgi:hypothetical protein
VCFCEAATRHEGQHTKPTKLTLSKMYHIWCITFISFWIKFLGHLIFRKLILSESFQSWWDALTMTCPTTAKDGGLAR